MDTRGHTHAGAGLTAVVLGFTLPAVGAGPVSGPGNAFRERLQEAPGPMVGPNVLISAARSSEPHVEPHAAVDPQDPDRLLVASIVIDEEGGWRCVSYISDDGGTAWRPSSGAPLEDLGDCGDPWVAFGPAGRRAYFSGLHADSADGRRVERIVVLGSDDRGATWTRRSEVPLGPDHRGGFDRPTMVVDATEGPHAGTVYITASQSVEGPRHGLHNSHPIGLSVSRDGGASFTPPLRILPTDLVYQSDEPVVLSDGSLALTFCDYATPDHERMLRVRRMWAVRSRDGGRSVSSPSFVAESSAYWGCANLATDGERVYSVWANTVTLAPEPAVADVDVVEDLGGGVYLARSDDGGQSWSAPLHVRSAPDRGETRRTVVAAGPEGVVAVAWMEATSSECFAPFVAVSTDGGDSFSEPARLSDTDRCVPPRTPGNVRGSFDVADRWPAGGDYFGLVHRVDGEFVAVWADSRAGNFQLWSASVRVGARR